MDMRKIRRILVPVDFSPAAGAAFRYASNLGAAFGARLIVLHVISPVYYLEPADFASLVHEARLAAEARLSKLRPAPSRALVEVGIPHDLIVQVAESVGADLIVIGTHGRSGLQRLMLGSVAENVVRHAPCPVLTVRGRT
jgi:universal stress protein A